ncbi:MAG: cytochrome C oxidase subunit I [Cyclobacteriaceae bacterium]|nr:cytochrome C oxidase subunit I [Cyclobacteriaceae bacterium]
MITGAIHLQKTTSHRVVLPFYLYAAFALVMAAWMLFQNSLALTGHHFQPSILAITHVMALGWGTMLIFGAAHQLLPVLIESKLYSETLAMATFILLALGIPLLSLAFYRFVFDVWALSGGTLVVVAVLLFCINAFMSVAKGGKENVHAMYLLSSATWLLFTCFWGFLLMLNFTSHIFAKNSIEYLSAHAHAGIIGWFLLLVIGVGSRLIPMFLISKYQNEKLLWTVFFLINTALLLYILQQIFSFNITLIYLSIVMIGSALLLFVWYILAAFRARIKKQIDTPMQLSLISILMLLAPLIVILLMLSGFGMGVREVLYGFTVFFGWLTAIIIGMTFKTLPFIVWNKVYKHQFNKDHQINPPNPASLFSLTVYRICQYTYVTGFLGFASGIVIHEETLLKISALILLTSALMYTGNVLLIIFHKPKTG